MQVVRRSDFVAAIERGIASAQRVLTIAEKMALRTVGATAQTARATHMGTQECRCPLGQIGLFSYDDGAMTTRTDPDDDRPLAYFWSAYDTALSPLLTSGTTFRIED